MMDHPILQGTRVVWEDRTGVTPVLRYGIILHYYPSTPSRIARVLVESDDRFYELALTEVRRDGAY